jgi:hypothetical protein
VNSLADVLANSSQVGADTVINFNGNVLTLVGVARSSLHADDFDFGGCSRC